MILRFQNSVPNEHFCVRHDTHSLSYQDILGTDLELCYVSYKKKCRVVEYPRTTVRIMRLSTLLPPLCLVTQALSASLSCEKHVDEMSLAESDAAVTEYFANLEPATKWALLHDITGPEAGADVRY